MEWNSVAQFALFVVLVGLPVRVQNCSIRQYALFKVKAVRQLSKCESVDMVDDFFVEIMRSPLFWMAAATEAKKKEQKITPGTLSRNGPEKHKIVKEPENKLIRSLSRAKKTENKGESVQDSD